MLQVVIIKLSLHTCTHAHMNACMHACTNEMNARIYCKHINYIVAIPYGSFSTGRVIEKSVKYDRSNMRCALVGPYNTSQGLYCTHTLDLPC